VRRLNPLPFKRALSAKDCIGLARITSGSANHGRKGRLYSAYCAAKKVALR
jgi:hypothetical protein